MENLNPKHKISMKDIFIGNTAQRIYIILITVLILLLMFSATIAPEKYNLDIGDIAPKTIRASKDVVDEVATESEKMKAAVNIEPVYVADDKVNNEVLAKLDIILSQLTLIQQHGKSIIEQDESIDINTYYYQFTDEQITYAKSLLTEITLGDYQIITLLRTTDEQWNDLTKNLKAAVNNTLLTSIREGKIDDSIEYIQQIVGYKTDINLLQNVVTPVLKVCIKPNMIIDQDATEIAKQEARDSVDPIIYKQGENIVIAGNRIYNRQYKLLENLGLLDNNPMDFTLYLSVLGNICSIIFLLFISLYILDKNVLKSKKQLMIICSAICITIGICIIINIVNLYLAPIVFCAMILCILLGARVAFASNIAVALLLSIFVASGDSTYIEEIINIIISTFFGGTLAIVVLNKYKHRQQILYAGLAASLISFITILFIGLLTKSTIDNALVNALWFAAGNLIASIICLGIEPIYETLFNLATPNRLMELCNPDQPLLRRLLLEAPGTYHHSIIVANLAETAAEAVGANTLLARAGGYYHDIGKLKRPQYFKENQMGVNPHQKTDPYISAQIVTSHIVDGYQLGKSNKLPTELLDIISQHHGNTAVMYFYHDAMQKSNGNNVDLMKFRYSGIKPQSVECAILMLADTVEAAVRSTSDHSPEAIKQFINKLIRAKIEDDQLNQAPITLQNIEQIKDAFTTVLSGIFHERIEYPSISPKDELEQSKKYANISKLDSNKDTANKEKVVENKLPVVSNDNGSVSEKEKMEPSKANNEIKTTIKVDNSNNSADKLLEIKKEIEKTTLDSPNPKSSKLSEPIRSTLPLEQVPIIPVEPLQMLEPESSKTNNKL